MRVIVVCAANPVGQKGESPRRQHAQHHGRPGTRNTRNNRHKIVHVEKPRDNLGDRQNWTRRGRLRIKLKTMVSARKAASQSTAVLPR